MYQLDDIIEFVKEETLSKRVTADSDIERDLGWTGDDFSELMEKYCQKYKVDMSSYLWYFHHDEEGSLHSIGGVFFKSPRQLVTHIPVTPKILFDFFQKGKWDLEYPEHSIPKKRYDILINQIVLFILVIWIIWYLIKKYCF
jgi:hypothetical protein